MAWSENDREQAIQRYRETGSTEIVRTEFGIPQSTLFSWIAGRKTPSEELAALPLDEAMRARAKLAWDGVDKALEKLLDRIENGEVRIGRNAPVAVSMSARDLCTAIGLLAQYGTKWEARGESVEEGDDDLFDAHAKDVDRLEQLVAEKKRRLGRGTEH